MDFICNRLEGLLVLDKLTDGVYWRLIRALVWMGLAGEMNLALFKGLQCTGFYHSRRLLGCSCTCGCDNLFQIGPLPVTSSMVALWGVALGILLVVGIGTRKMALVPTGSQNFVEAVVDAVRE